MNKYLPALLLACGLALAGASQAAAQAANADAGAPAASASADEAVRATIGDYLRGHATGDPSHFRKAFLPTAHVETIRDGAFTSWTLDEYCAFFKGTPASDENLRMRTIDFVDTSGNTAVARVTLDYPAILFTDYFLLLNVNGEWKIANKIATNRRKNAP